MVPTKKKGRDARMNSRKQNPKKKPQKPVTELVRGVLLFILIFVVVSFLYAQFSNNEEIKEVNITEIASKIKVGEVTSIVVKGTTVEVEYKDTTKVKTLKEPQVSFSNILIEQGVTSEQLAQAKYDVQKETGFGYWAGRILPFIFPLLMLLVLLWFFTRQMGGSGGMKPFSFGQSRAKMVDPNNKENRITFKDVAGAKEAKIELEEFVDFLKAPQKYIEIGAKIPKGVLLTGLPGNGKTLLSRAVAGEARVPFFTISGSEFVEMFVGVGAARVRDLFATAKKVAPSIIFIDELDAVGRSRGAGSVGGGNDEREQTLNQILVEMDGFEQNDKVIVMAATNRADVLDSALLRPGRFDRKVIIDPPDIKDRENILRIHSKKKQLEDKIDFLSIAKRTPGFSGADLYSVVNEAAIRAVRFQRNKISQEDYELSVEKVILGPERKSHLLSEYEKKVVAYHEGGHALLSSILPYADPVHKISIIPRGVAAGYVLALPDEERKLKTKKHFMDDITMALGGYVVEKMIFGAVSTGPSNDLERVTDIAHSMVTRWGMSDKIGPIVVHRPHTHKGKEEHAIETEKLIDDEIAKIINTALKTAQTLIKQNMSILEAIAKKLLEVETMERAEFEKLVLECGGKLNNKVDK